MTVMISERVRRYRKERGLSAEQLSAGCNALGLPISRNMLANFETGRWSSVSVAELLVIAMALDVAPMALLFPHNAIPVEVLPGRRTDSFAAICWFTGPVSWKTTITPELAS